ncbi:MAG: tRNA (adenosine(37)-N6)-dimethylallyltransferase MiaA [Isosphaeraceae bacterium]|nr:tRNA (adenosine(37)-N6)-dimethylallyltransferase MiaA [Isosphaeraceae bacterium]
MPDDLEPDSRRAGFHRAIYLTGPTASGKSAIGVELARLLDAEIIALDSMTLYRGMDIGTAKPTSEERGGIEHHLIDVLDPWEGSSVADYLARSGDAIERIEARGKRVLFVGGTPLYLKACLRGIFDGPGADQRLRADLIAIVERDGATTLHDRLRRVDPATAERLHPHDVRRVVRALEIHELTGRTASDLQREHDRPAPAEVRVIALERPRPQLHSRIDRRVEAMFEQGLEGEVARLRSGPLPLHSTPAQAVGYLETSLLLDGAIDRATAIERTQARSRQLAKRQETWFRGLAEVERLVVEDRSEPVEVAWAIGRRLASPGGIARSRDA